MSTLALVVQKNKLEKQNQLYITERKNMVGVKRIVLYANTFEIVMDGNRSRA